MKFTSKKIFCFAFIIILIGIIWTMFFSKSREGACSDIYGDYTDSKFNACNNAGCTASVIKRPFGNGISCSAKRCSDFGTHTTDAYKNPSNIAKCSNQKLAYGGNACRPSSYNNTKTGLKNAVACNG